MNVEETAKYVSEKTGLPYHRFLAYMTGDVRIECSKGKHKPSEEAIKSFEDEIDWKLPQDFRAFLLNFGAVYMEATEKVWPNIEGIAVMPFWATNYGFIIYGLGTDVPEHLDIRRKFYQFKDIFRDMPFFLPIQRLVAGDQTYIGYNEKAELVEKFSHSDELHFITKTFDELVLGEAKDLQERIVKRSELDIKNVVPKSNPDSQPASAPETGLGHKLKSLFKKP